MSRHFVGPRAGSNVYKSLSSLHAIGGAASLTEWMNTVKWSGSIQSFERDFVNTLLRQQMIYQRGDHFQITDDGLDLLGIPVNAAPAIAPVLAGPRYVGPVRTLAIKNTWRDTARDGALDYRDIPSRIGEAVVEYGGRSSATASGRTTT